MLEQVLTECKDRVVNSTVRNLPLTTVVPFLKTVSFHCYDAVWKCLLYCWSLALYNLFCIIIQLVDLLQTRPSRGPELSIWIRAILLSHTAYLLTVSYTPRA